MSDADTLPAANPWRPMTRPIDLKHLGKLAEEIGEAVTAVVACMIQGLDARDPGGDGKSNRIALEDELADVLAGVQLVAVHLALDSAVMHRRPVPPLNARYLGELGRALGVAGAAVARCIIQGIDEREPVTGRLNRTWLEDALGALAANIQVVVLHFDLDAASIGRRIGRKKAQLKQWHGMLD